MKKKPNNLTEIENIVINLSVNLDGGIIKKMDRHARKRAVPSVTAEGGYL